MIKENEKSIVVKNITKVNSEKSEECLDNVAVEEPLEISISALRASPPIANKSISITMRTPGNDEDLATGFLFTEGIIVSADQITTTKSESNSILFQLNDAEGLDLSKLERHFYTSSSCGVCGKASIEAIKTECRLPPSPSEFQINKSLILSLPSILMQQQRIFNNTGGIHAAALFDLSGKLLALREDVGRHNALDKLIGHSLRQGQFPLGEHLLFLSGRASFELIQKAAMAGIHFIIAVGAPSSLAIEMAQEHNITLVGFVSNSRYNIYTGVQRIKI